MPPRKKPDTAGFEKLKQNLSEGKPGQLYMFHGEETYLRDHYLEQLKKALIPAGMEAFNYHPLDGKGLTVQRLGEVVDALPMMSQHTLLVVSDYDLFKAPERERTLMAQLLEELPAYCCLVFLYDILEYKPDARTKLAQTVKAHSTVVNFARQSPRELVDWVRRHFKAQGKEIDSRLCEELIFLCGDLMHSLQQEIGKIAAYAKGDKITRADIEAVATPQLSAVVFRIADAIGEKNFDRAAATLGELYQMQKSPYEIMGAFGKQMRQLYSARLALAGGKGAAWVAQLWGMRYPADRLLVSARRFSLQWCRRAVVRCAQTDLAMKSTGQDAKELMTTLLLELANTT